MAISVSAPGDSVFAGIVNTTDPLESVTEADTYVPLESDADPVGIADPDPATATVTDRL